jgi:hypothetical protein
MTRIARRTGGTAPGPFRAVLLTVTIAAAAASFVGGTAGGQARGTAAPPRARATGAMARPSLDRGPLRDWWAEGVKRVRIVEWPSRRPRRSNCERAISPRRTLPAEPRFIRGSARRRRRL